MRIVRVSLIFGIAHLFCAVSALLAAGVKATPLPAEDALAARIPGEVSPLAFSSDGVWLAYMVQDLRRIPTKKGENAEESYVRTGVIDRNQESDIWISNVETGASRNLTGGRGSNWQPTWSPDGRLLAFLSDRDGSGQAKLWIWESRTDQLRLASPVPVRMSAVMNEIKWTPDSKRVVIATLPEGLSLEDYVRKVLPTSRPVTSDAVPGSTVRLFNASQKSSARVEPPNDILFNEESDYLHDLSLVDLAAGHTKTVVHGRMIGRYSLSPNGTEILYSVPTARENARSFRKRFDLVVLNLLTFEERVITPNVLLGVASWSPDGSHIAFSGEGPDETSYDYYVVPAVGGNPRQVSRLESEVGLPQMPMWEQTGEYFYFISHGALFRSSILSASARQVAQVAGKAILAVIPEADGLLWTLNKGKTTVVLTRDNQSKSDGFYKVELGTGETTKLLEQHECYRCKRSYFTGVSPDAKRIVYIAQDAQHAPDLWVSDSEFHQPTQVTHLNPQIERCVMGSAHTISWLNNDGEQLSGALMLPPGYRVGVRYPLVVLVYPAALSNEVYRFGFGQYPGPFNVQLFSTRGYAVLAADARERVGDRLAGLASSVLSGVNKVIEMGVADPHRIGVIGHSQGGYAVMALLVQTTRFRWAISADGWSDFTGFYGVLRKDATGYAFGQAERQLGGAPWEYPARYVFNSPVYYLDRIETPLLIIHGGDDPDLPSFLADELFVGLRRLGKQVEYLKYDGEGHSPRDWSYLNQVDLANRVLAWMATYGGVASETAAAGETK